MAATPTVFCVSWDCVKTKNDPEIAIPAQLVEEIVVEWTLVKWLRKSKLRQ